MNKDSEQLVLDMRECASLLQKFASDSEFLAMDKTASVTASAPSTSRADYMAGLMDGLGLAD